MLAMFFLILSYLIPNLTQPWLSFYRELFAYGFVFSLYWGMSPNWSRRVPVPRVLWIIGFCLIVVLMQYGFGRILFSGDLAVILPFLLGIAVAFMCGASLYSSEFHRQVLDIFIITLLLIALFSAFLSIYQWFGIDILGGWSVFVLEVPLGVRVIANMGQPNHLATLLVMGFGSGLFLYHHAKIHLFLFILCITVLAIAQILTESNTGLLSTLTVALFYLFSSCKSKQIDKITQWLICYWCGLILVGFLYLGDMKQVLLLSDTVRQLESSTGSRLLIYQKILYALSLHPWTGYGWLNTLTAVHDATAYLSGSEAATYSHNLFLDILIWNGIPAGVIIMSALLYWGVSRYFFRINANTFLVCIITLPFWVHCMTEFPFAFAYFTFPIAVLCGYIDAASIPAQRNYLFVLNKKFINIMMLCVAVFGVVATYAYIAAEKQFLQVRLLNTNILLSEPYRHKKIIIFNQLDAFTRASLILPSKNISESDILLYQNVIRRFPSPLIESRYLLSLIFTGQYERYQKELIAISNIHSDQFSYDFNMSVDRNPNIPVSVKKKTAEILKLKIHSYLLQKNGNLDMEITKTPSGNPPNRIK